MGKMLDISHNRLRKIEGLENLPNLTRLYLVSNKIAKIENLESCTKLEMLELGDNKILIIFSTRMLDIIYELSVLHEIEWYLPRCIGIFNEILSSFDRDFGYRPAKMAVDHK